MKQSLLHAVLLVLILCAPVTSALGQPFVTIETVTVGDPGNAADAPVYGASRPVGPGSVPYSFAMGKFEVTISQYSAFLNSVGAVPMHGYLVDLWNPNMETDLNIAGISRSGAGTLADPFVYTPISPSGLTPVGASSAGARPISYVSWFDAARFANWLHNGATNGANTEIGAYTLNGATNGAILRNPGASWWIPSEDEWHKAAYYKGGGTNEGYWRFPTQSSDGLGNTIGNLPNNANHYALYTYTFSVTQSVNSSNSQNYLTEVGAFSGSPSTYGTFDQGGNVAEWNDTVFGLSDRGFQGGGFSSDRNNLANDYQGHYLDPSEDSRYLGFRVATVPEPSTYALLLLTGAGALWLARRKRD
jgi:sulfatase modifying factor 1